MILASHGIISSSGASTPLLLDTYSGASAAYSLRKLNTAYTGYAIRVRRSSDNTSQDIGFDGLGNLDATSLLSFVGANNGFVSIWYDQSGNSNNAVQNTLTYQPKLVNSGSILLINSKPSLLLDGVDDLLSLSSTIFTNTSHYHSFVGKRAASGDRLYGLAGDGTSGYNYLLGLWSDNNYYLQGKSAAYQYSNSTDTATNQLLISGKNVSGTMSIYKNGGTISSTQGSSAILPNINSIGKATSTFFPANCSLQEIVFYNNDQTTNQAGIETNINTHYTIY